RRPLGERSMGPGRVGRGRPAAASRAAAEVRRAAPAPAAAGRDAAGPASGLDLDPRRARLARWPLRLDARSLGARAPRPRLARGPLGAPRRPPGLGRRRVEIGTGGTLSSPPAPLFELTPAQRSCASRR